MCRTTPASTVRGAHADVLPARLHCGLCGHCTHLRPQNDHQIYCATERGRALRMRSFSAVSVGLWSVVSATAAPRREQTQRLSPALATSSSLPLTSATTCQYRNTISDTG